MALQSSRGGKVSLSKCVYRSIMSNVVVLDLLYGQWRQTGTSCCNSSHLGKKVV